MQISVINTTPPAQIPEIFFIDKCLELLYHGTIETYRLQLHNPRTALNELVNIARSRNHGEISNDDHVKLMAEEVQFFFRSETFLNLEGISKPYLDKVLKEKFPSEVFYLSNLILSKNSDYITNLFILITSKIAELNLDAALNAGKLLVLGDLASYFLIELRERGYSKRYLHKFITEIFYTNVATDFGARMAILQSLINNPLNNYQIIVGFKLSAAMAGQLIILDPILQKMTSSSIRAVVRRTNNRVRSYFSSKPQLQFYSLTVNALDYYKASYLVRKELQLTLDVLFMGYTNGEFDVEPACVVIGNTNPRKASIQHLDFHLEGHFKSEQSLYDAFSANIGLMKTKPVALDTINKIESALRYLRSGSEVNEIENKLLNYWIAVEYFFSGASASANKVARARKYFKKIHAITYFKRLLVDFHASIKLYGVQGLIPTFAEDMEYLKVLSNFDLISANIATPALAARASQLKKRLILKKAISDSIVAHANKLEWNLMRIYRRRNSIVHSAKSENDILDLASHLKYYLVFIINSAINFINTNPIDLNMDGKISLDDFFNLRHAEYESLILDPDLNVDKLLQYQNPLEYLT